MATYYLKFVLMSEAAFSRGDGVAGEVDSEVQHDELGCPYLGGRAIKGILANECADILAAIPKDKAATWKKAARRLFGQPGSAALDDAYMAIGNAQLPEDLRAALSAEQAEILAQLDRQAYAEAQGLPKSEQHKIWSRLADDRQAARNAFRIEILESLTTIRYQTAMDKLGTPKEHSLRSQRVVLRDTPFLSILSIADVQDGDLQLLSACVKAFRRAGANRNRGKGCLRAQLLDEKYADITERYYAKFKQEALQ